jgi:hypothetical protein
MKSKNVKYYLFLFIICFWFISGCGEEKPKGINEIVYEYGNNIFFYDLNKNKTAQIFSKKPCLNNRDRDCCIAYFFPDLYAVKNILTCIEVENYFSNSSGPETENNQRCNLLLFNREKNEKIVLDNCSGMDGKICYPIFSSDGKKIYYLKSNSIYSVNISTRLIEKVFEFPDGQEGGLDYYAGNLSFSKDGKKLYVMMLNHKKVTYIIWATNIENKTSEKLWEGKTLPLRIPPNIADAEACLRLFGSFKNPVAGPKFINDFYIYKRKKEGFFANYWIGACEINTGKQYSLKVLDKSLYQE